MTTTTIKTKNIIATVNNKVKRYFRHLRMSLKCRFENQYDYLNTLQVIREFKKTNKVYDNHRDYSNDPYTTVDGLIFTKGSNKVCGLYLDTRYFSLNPIYYHNGENHISTYSTGGCMVVTNDIRGMVEKYNNYEMAGSERDKIIKVLMKDGTVYTF